MPAHAAPHASVILDVLAVLGLIAVPGLGASLAAHGPGRAGPVTRLALVFGFGYAIAGGVAFVLALAHVLTLPAFLVALGVVTAGLWIAALRGGRAREHLRSLVADVRGDPWTLGLGLVVLVGIAVVRAGYAPVSGGHLVGPPGWTPFRYFVDALEVADGGRIPDTSLMYGSLYPAATSKSFLNAFTAGAVLVAGRQPLVLMPSLLWVSSVGVAVALWGFAREVGLRWTAPLVPLLLVAGRLVPNELVDDMGSYRAEVMGRMAAACVLVLGVRTLRQREGWREPVLAAGMAGAAAGTHLVPLGIAALFLLWYAVGRILVDREVKRVAARAAVLAGAAAILGGLVVVLPAGQVGFGGVAATYDELNRRLGFDATLYLGTGNVVPGSELRGGRSYVRPDALVRRWTAAATGADPEDPGPPSWIVPLLGVATAVALFLRGPPQLRPLAPAAVGVALSLLAGAALFSLRYHVWVLGTFGVRRLYDYAQVPVVLIGVAAVEWGVAAFARLRSWAPLAAGAAVVVTVAAFALPSAAPRPRDRATGRAAETLVRWIRDHTACDARILTSERTIGVYRALAGRVVLLEGMGPYLRPDMLGRVTHLMLGARRFFLHPERSLGFLEDQGVDYVVMMKGLHLGRRGHTATRDWEQRAAALHRIEFIDPIVSSPWFDVYRVAVPVGEGFPGPEGRPAYGCLRGPVLAGVAG